MMGNLKSRVAIMPNVTNQVIKYVLVCFALCMTTVAFSQATISRGIECACLDNNAPDGFAQFEELIVVESNPGETWYIESVSGFYQLGSPVPPASQIEFQTGVNGDTLVSNGSDYSLEGLLLEDVGYSITLTNGIDTLSLSNILCLFPSSEILGDDAICGLSTETYIAENIDPSYTYSWDVDDSGTIVGATNNSSVEVEWNGTPGELGLLRLEVTGPTGCSSVSFMNVEFEDDINMACNNTVHLSINSECGLELTVDDIVENMQYNDDSYVITITDPETGLVLDLEDDASDYLFQTLEVAIEHLCSENICWGNLIIEDKLVPQLICENDTIRCDASDSPNVTGFPVPADADVFYLGGNNFRVEGFDPCGDANLTYTDYEYPLDCDEDFGAVLERTWLLTDFSGSTNTCTQSIFKVRTTVSDVVFPGDWDSVTNPTLACDGNYPKLPNGYPDPSYTGIPVEGICDHMSFSYVDLISEVCGASYKIVRKMTVHDDCTGEKVTNNQIIKIEDSEAPSFNCPGYLTFDINQGSDCTTNVSTPLPTNVYDCSEVTFEAEIVKINSAGNIAGPISYMTQTGNSFFSNNRELGRHRVTYYATDGCGLESSCSFIVEVFDNTPPVAVCDLNTTIAIDTEGLAVVPVSTFNNGSFDNCEIESIEISRGYNECGGYNGFSDEIVLCCEDVNTEVAVTLRVTDVSGNVNTCMVMVMVQDKKPPVLSCPANTVISCNDDITNLDVYGVATVTDNCSATITEEVTETINGCFVGKITRTFYATDTGGNVTSCTQTITVQDPDPLQYYSIVWPANYETNDCVSPNLHPDDLPYNNAYPQIPNNQCSNITVDFYDKVYYGVNTTACKTIIRTWKVVDLCGDIDGFEFPQTLKIIDNQIPQFEECSNKVLTGSLVDDCLYQVDYQKVVSDNCTPVEDLEVHYCIDFYSDGLVNIQADTSVILHDLPVGQHKIVWTVKDDCSNENECVEFITIEDTKKPTPYCFGGISTVLMPSTGTVDIWASDFDANSEDDCTAQGDLEFSFNENPSSTGRTFTCADLDGAEEKIIELEIYVHDEAGNFDFCTSYIRLRDNNNTCDTSSTLVTLSGYVATEDLVQMKDVDMKLTNMSQGSSTNEETNGTGVYAFQGLDAMVDYSIAPSYSNDNAANGISTLDILLIQKHILGLKPLDSPYKVIAADVDGNEMINGIDIIQIRKLLLGYFDEFPLSDTWKFVDGTQQFADPYAPWPYNTKMDLFADQSYADVNFVMIKTGDMNLSRTTSFQDEEPVVRTNPLELTYTWEEQNGAHVLKINAAEVQDWNGFQMELELAENVELQGLESAFGIKEDAVYIDGKTLRVSWSGASAQRVGGTLLEFTFGATTPIKIAKDGRFQSEVYLAAQNGIDIQGISLRAENQEKEVFQTRVFQNKPNPFMDETEIIVELRQKDEVTIEVHDMNGQLKMSQKLSLEEGRNSIRLTKEDVNAVNGGVFIYTVSGAFGQISKRMIIIQ